MSCIPLISHHLFVAALSEKNNLHAMPGLVAQAFSAPEISAREVPVELVDFGRPLPLETDSGAGPWGRMIPLS